MSQEESGPQVIGAEISSAWSLADVAEVVEVRGAQRANEFLAHGYRLITVHRRAREETRRGSSTSGGTASGETYVAHWGEFILARDSSVAHYQMSPRERPGDDAVNQLRAEIAQREEESVAEKAAVRRDTHAVLSEAVSS